MGETSLANGVVQCFEDNGMVKKENYILKALYRTSGSSLRWDKDVDRTEYRTLAPFLTTDISKYCLNQRVEMLEPFTDALDGISRLSGFFIWHGKRQKTSILCVADLFCPTPNELQQDNPPLEDPLLIPYPAKSVVRATVKSPGH